MINLNQLLDISSSAVITASVVGAFGLCRGYIYAKLSDLPVNQVAKAFAIWGIAQSAIFSVGNLCFNKKMPRRIFKVLSLMLLDRTVLWQLEKRSLIGPKFKALIIIGNLILALAVPILDIVESKIQENLNSMREAAKQTSNSKLQQIKLKVETELFEETLKFLTNF